MVNYLSTGNALERLFCGNDLDFYEMNALENFIIRQRKSFFYRKSIGNVFLRDISYLPNPSARAGYDTRSIFKRSLTGLSSEFSLLLD